MTFAICNGNTAMQERRRQCCLGCRGGKISSCGRCARCGIRSWLFLF